MDVFVHMEMAAYTDREYIDAILKHSVRPFSAEA